jgi:hypothetical protein
MKLLSGMALLLFCTVGNTAAPKLPGGLTGDREFTLACYANCVRSIPEKVHGRWTLVEIPVKTFTVKMKKIGSSFSMRVSPNLMIGILYTGTISEDGLFSGTPDGGTGYLDQSGELDYESYANHCVFKKRSDLGESDMEISCNGSDYLQFSGLALVTEKLSHGSTF